MTGADCYTLRYATGEQAATNLQIVFPDVPREQIEDDVEDLFDDLVDEGLVILRA